MPSSMDYSSGHQVDQTTARRHKICRDELNKTRALNSALEFRSDSKVTDCIVLEFCLLYMYVTLPGSLSLTSNNVASESLHRSRYLHTIRTTTRHFKFGEVRSYRVVQESGTSEYSSEKRVKIFTCFGRWSTIVVMLVISHFIV